MSWFPSGSNPKPNPQICKCGAIYAPYLHIADVRKITGQLVECKRCTQDAEPEVLFPHVYRRVFMDIAHRYIEWFGGPFPSVSVAGNSTFATTPAM